MALTVFWFGTYYFFPKEFDIQENSSSILFWNVADKENIPIDILLEKIKKLKPKIIALVEAENASEEDIQILSKTIPNYTFQLLKGNMLIGMKGSIVQHSFVNEDYSHKLNYVEGIIDNQPISLVIADIYASPIMNKKRTLNIVSQFAVDKNASFVVGDFNTPYQSVHFKTLETSYTSFHDYGEGFTTTWPYKIPLFELDQIFLSKEITPILLKKFYYSVSDHAMLIGYYQN